MNPQPHPIVGQFGVLIFALLVAYFCFTGNKRRLRSINDEFVLGYIYDNAHLAQTINQDNVSQKQTKRPSQQKNNTNVTSSTVTTPSIQTHKNPQEITPVTKSVKQVIDEDLFNDCVLALTSLGAKKAESKSIAKKIFDEHKPETIEDFIKFVYFKT